MPAKRKPAPPTGLSAAGKRLWKAIINDVAADWELDAKDLALLAEAAKTADTLDKLEKAVKKDGATVYTENGRPLVHPAIDQANKLRGTQQKLLAAIDLEPNDDATARSRFARDAARARWGPNTHVFVTEASRPGPVTSSPRLGDPRPGVPLSARRLQPICNRTAPDGADQRYPPA
jgi:P27 family predicted phage terminase small subunit